MGQSQSLSLESNDNLENDEIRNAQNKRDVLSINNHEPKMIENDAFLSTEGQTIHTTNTDKNNDTCVEEYEQKEDKKNSDEIVTDTSEYAVDYTHVHTPIAEFADSIQTTDKHSAFKLLDIFEKMKIESNDYSMWQVGNKQSAKNRMKHVIEYAENNATCCKDTKIKLRIITKLIMESKTQNDYKYILLLIASHGSVCNVMKEVAINNAYHTMTNNLSEYIKSQSLQQQILKVLYDYRILLVEKLFHWFGFCNNTHYIAGFHNQIAKEIGVKPYNDPNISYPTSKKHTNWRNNLDKRYFKTMYTKENILKWIITQINEKKIGYQKVVRYFENNCPKDIEKNKFLTMVIDIDTGEINEKYLCWLLEKLNVFIVKCDEWKDIEKCWDDELEINKTAMGVGFGMGGPMQQFPGQQQQQQLQQLQQAQLAALQQQQQLQQLQLAAVQQAQQQPQQPQQPQQLQQQAQLAALQQQQQQLQQLQQLAAQMQKRHGMANPFAIQQQQLQQAQLAALQQQQLQQLQLAAVQQAQQLQQPQQQQQLQQAQLAAVQQAQQQQQLQLAAVQQAQQAQLAVPQQQQQLQLAAVQQAQQLQQAQLAALQQQQLQQLQLAAVQQAQQQQQQQQSHQ